MISDYLNKIFYEMKRKIWLILFTLGLSLSCFAQDTIKVQTFDWNSNTRADYFQFPDEPGQSFEKIIMKYNMRCHDAAVGNGNVGCREWDYSCNTFITDPNLVDSTFATHPTHVITNFSGLDFQYTTQTVVDYIQYEMSNTTATHINSSDVTVMGDINTATSSDLMEARVGRKIQFLYSADDLSSSGLSAGAIHALELSNAGASGTVDFLKIKLQQTSLTSLSANEPTTDNWTEVYFSHTDFDDPGTQTLYFSQSFDWDGSSNLLVEMSYSSQEGAGNQELLVNDAAEDEALISETNDYALEMNGFGALDISTAQFGSISNEITVMLWTYGLSDQLPVNTTIFEGRGSDDRRQVNVHLPWGNSQVYWDCGNDGSGYDRINKAANPEDFEGKWNHWAFTKNANTGEMHIYLNGELWHSGSGLTKPINLQRFVLGQNIANSVAYFGRLDDFSVWDVALDESTIQNWMNRKITAEHPMYAHLLSYLNFDDPNQIGADTAPNAINANTLEYAHPIAFRGDDIFKNLSNTSSKAVLGFVQGDIETATTTESVLGATNRAPNVVTSYMVDSFNDLQQVDQVFLWEASPSFIYDENGIFVDFIPNDIEGVIEIETLEYFQKREAKFELLSFVTPYGNGLSLGPEGKTWYFDVTDYAPILRGNKRLSLEMGGQWQEEMDIEFWFITGTPVREVLSIANIWPFRRGWYDQIQNDVFFEPRMLRFDPAGEAFKIRAAITGHGQNGEFVPRQHYIDINGGNQEFTYDVWKECGDNPVFPQGGTWIFDRAGWCPGMATDVQQFDITNWALSGDEVIVDYGVNGDYMAEANYLVSTQLVTYGAPNYGTEVSLESVIRPSKQVEYERINPACKELLIEVKNNGINPITELEVEYQVIGGLTLSHTWTGNLAFLETAIIELPVTNLTFWETSEESGVFEARIISINGDASDELAYNNQMQSVFDVPEVLDYPNLEFKTLTNNRASENRFNITNFSGDVIVSRDNMNNYSEYNDLIDFSPGCYTLSFEDDGDDGLQFWYWDVIGEDVGSGSIRFERQVTPDLEFPVQFFNSDFGSGVQFDFIIPGVVNTEEVTNTQRFSAYPNPTSGPVTLEWEGQSSQRFQVQVRNAKGQLMLSTAVEHFEGAVTIENIDLSQLAAGVYSIHAIGTDKTTITQVVKL